MVEKRRQTSDSLESRLKVSCLARAATVAEQWKPTKVISLLDPCLAADKIPSFPAASHSVFLFFDQESIPATAHLGQIGRELRSELEDVYVDDRSRLLIHCHAGASRSTAAALIAICVLRPDISGRQAFQDLLKLCTKPWPNRRIIEEMSRDIHQRRELLEAVDLYRREHPRRLEAYRRLNPRRGIFSPVQR